MERRNWKIDSQILSTSRRIENPYVSRNPTERSRTRKMDLVVGKGTTCLKEGQKRTTCYYAHPYSYQVTR